MLFGLRFRERLQAAGDLGAAIINEFQNMMAALVVWAEVEHDQDGRHKAITAHSLTLRRDAQDGATGLIDANGTEQHIIGGPVIIDGVVEAGRQISGGAGTGAIGAGVSIDGAPDGYSKYAINVSGDNYNQSLGIYNATDGTEVLKLYRTALNNYTLSPSEDGIALVKLGDQADTDLEFDEIAGKLVYARQGYFALARSVAEGAWTTFTPTFTNLTLGNGTLVARYSRVNKTVEFTIVVIFGSTTSVTGTVQVTMPTAHVASAGALATGDLTVLDASSGLFYPGKPLMVASPTVTLFVDGIPASSVAYTALAAVTATAPITFTTGDQIAIRGSYEEA